MGGGGASERLDLGRVPLEQFEVAEVMPSTLNSHAVQSFIR
jgi:hypothetical protein